MALERTLLPGTRHWLDAPALQSYQRMRNAGMPPGVTSMGRTWEYQLSLYDDWLSGRGTFALHPSKSEHVAGRAMDLPRNKDDDRDTSTPAGWVRVHGRPYGWTDVDNEKWHFNYNPEHDQHLGEDMPYKDWPQADRQQLCEDVANYVLKSPLVEKLWLYSRPDLAISMSTVVKRDHQTLGKILALVSDPTTLATEIVKQLPAGADQATIEAALRAVLGSIDED